MAQALRTSSQLKNSFVSAARAAGIFRKVRAAVSRRATSASPSCWSKVFTTAGDTNPTYVGNVILVATESAAPSQVFLQQRWAAVRKQAPTAPDLTRAIKDRWERQLPFGDVPVLTDDYAPTDALLTD